MASKAELERALGAWGGLAAACLGRLLAGSAGVLAWDLYLASRSASRPAPTTAPSTCVCSLREAARGSPTTRSEPGRRCRPLRPRPRPAAGAALRPAVRRAVAER